MDNAATVRKICDDIPMNEPEITIAIADADVAGELLTLRRAAFVTEAQMYGDPNIPPLTQTLEELTTDLNREDVVTLAARLGHRLVGSVRVELEDGKATLGRLAVAPDLQGQGIGTQMMLAVLPHLPDETTEIWVFTGKDSKQNISLYERNGYEHQHEQVAGDLTYAYLRKILGEDA